MSFSVVKLLDAVNNIVVTGGLVPRGHYDNDVVYDIGDAVEYNDSSYLKYKVSAAGVLPSDTEYWSILGAVGYGVSTGGTTGQSLVKNSNTDYDTAWKTLTESDISDLQNYALSSALTTHTGDNSIHFTEASINHANILNTGTNTHDQIDSHINNSLIHYEQGSISIPHTQINDWNTATSGFLTSFTETDPVFVSSPAYNIQTTNINNWNTAYSWGNHSTQGYLTTINGLSNTLLINDANYLTSYTETDPIFSSSVAAGIASTDVSNWNNAYGWGDHSAQGYVTGTPWTSEGYLTSISGLSNTLLLNDANYIKNLSSFTTDNLTEGSTNKYDQTVTLTEGANITITGTYPSFTIAASGGGGTVNHNELSNLDFANSGHVGFASTSALALHTTDSTIHFTQAGITIATTQITNFPTNVSSFTNDSNFITTIAGLSNTSLVNDANYISSELDPVFVSSPAYNIQSSNISNWNDSYSWGNHANAGYVTGTPWTSEGYLTSISGLSNTLLVNDAQYVTGTPWQSEGYLTSISGLSNTDLVNDAGYITGYNETDPIFVQSPSYNIQTTDINNWNSAYGWGNHADSNYLTTISGLSNTLLINDANYLTSISGLSNTDLTNDANYLTSETDPVFSSSPAFGIQTTDVNNWNTAYNWGDHSSEGYITTISGLSNTLLLNDAGYVSNLTGFTTDNLTQGATNKYDQTVVLNEGSNVTITGTYPEFTVAATDTNSTYVASDFDIKDLTDSTNLRTAWSGKQDAITAGVDYEVPLTFSTGLTRTNNTITCNITQYTDSNAVTAIKADAAWKASDWDTAYGWGNHSTAGYLTTISGLSNTLLENDANYLTSISGLSNTSLTNDANYVSSSTTNKITVSDTEPLTPTTGDLWVDIS